MEKANLELFEMLFNKFVEDATADYNHYYYDAEQIGCTISSIVNVFGQMKQLIEQAKKIED